MTGVKIGNRIVLFAKNGNPENRPINLNINGTGTFKVLITDLEKGNWEVTGPGSPGVVGNDHNLVYFQATAGNYVIAKK
jgi:heparin/heparan-sulfate lyase